MGNLNHFLSHPFLMSGMRRVLFAVRLVLMAAVWQPATALSEPREPPDEPSPSTATDSQVDIPPNPLVASRVSNILTWGGAGFGCLGVAAGFLVPIYDLNSVLVGGVGLVALSLIVGPSIGNMYAKNGARAAVFIVTRLVTASVGSAAIAIGTAKRDPGA